jgi:hypothetical protein
MLRASGIGSMTDDSQARRIWCFQATASSSLCTAASGTDTLTVRLHDCRKRGWISGNPSSPVTPREMRASKPITGGARLPSTSHFGMRNT